MQIISGIFKMLPYLANPRVISVAQMRALETWAMETVGIPSLVLMENAARNCAQILIERAETFKPPILILAGRGNNGGDGLAIARQLDGAGVPTRTILIGPLERCSPECQIQARALLAAGYPLVVSADGLEIEPELAGAGSIVDALFGIGLTRPLEAPYSTIVESINRSGLPVLAVDIPSGLDGDTGLPVGTTAVKATLTASIGGLKKGLVLPCAEIWTGEKVTISLGLPKIRQTPVHS